MRPARPPATSAHDRTQAVWGPWLLGWMGLALLAVMNGTVRQLGYQPYVG
ncbi:MAG TPA: hypothetical protein VK923_12785 [Euzebyales bacterium]|nr:hypothetical protein [Euzebyales bacterium]